MTRDTVRDNVWRVVVTLATDGCGEPESLQTLDEKVREYAAQSYEGAGFTKEQVLERVDASDRTVHDVLKTMVQYGLLDSTPRSLTHVLPNKRENRPDRHTRQNTTVYYAAGQLGTPPVDDSELIGYSAVFVDDVEAEIDAAEVPQALK
jgi:hypothetical protein